MRLLPRLAAFGSGLLAMTAEGAFVLGRESIENV
jgi:hypothetical protein